MTDTELELPQGWTISTINQVCETSSGGTPSRGKPEYYGGTIPWIKSGELKESMIYDSNEKITKIGLENSSAKIFPKGTVLLALYGANIGNTGLLQIDSATNQAVCAIFNDKDILHTDYLLWYIRFIKKNLVKQAIGGAQPNISQTIVNKLEIPISPLNEQKRIISKIEELFSKIDSAKQSLEHTKLQLEQYRQSLLTSAFEGKGWEEVGLGEFADFKNGINFTKNEKGKKGIPTIDVFNMYSGSPYPNTENVYRVNKKTSDDFLLENNDILFVRSSVKRQGVGWVTLFKKSNEKMTYCGFIIRARFSADIILPKYLLYYLRSPKARNELISSSSQVVISNINQQSLSKILIPVAPINEQEQIVLQIEQGFSLIENSQSIVNFTLQTLQTIKISILKQAFEGKLVPQDPNDEPASELLKQIKN